jgi:hypothetical protein
MDEPTAWLYQARHDRQAAERFVEDEKGTDRCHAIAKWQQAVEKAIKAIVCALHEAGILQANFRRRHEVDPYVAVLIRLPRSAGNRTIQSLLHGLLDQNTRGAIRVLDGLAPQMPPRRNTEYPFQNEAGTWTYPAAKGVFSESEVEQFRSLAHRILESTGRIVSAIRRRPR